MQSKKCLECGKKYIKYYRPNSKYCSRECSKKQTCFKKGHSVGVRFGRDKDSSGENNSKWKGDGVGYSALHDWCKRHFLKPEECESCGISEEEHRKKTGKTFDLSCNGIYNREKENWEWLCKRCHRLKDVAMMIKNKQTSSDNKSGVTGVCWDKERKKWMAFISIEGKQKRLGRFNRKKDAIKARRIAEKKYNKFLKDN